MLLRSVLPFARGSSRTEMWALRDVDFSIARGETVGVIGRNGAGKTTLLRLLAGVSRPTEGVVRVAGRVAPLISVGVGFHPEMSGRENVFVNGMLLGLTEHQINERFDDIVAFAELPEFIDTPVKFYSSGMAVRLGFSVAIHAEPEILLLDEILAVGDLAFQLKCFDRMREIQQSGTTILLVSHSMHAIRLLCPRAIVLSRGELDFDGDANQAVNRHHELLSLETQTDGQRQQSGFVGGARIIARDLLGPDGPMTEVRQDTPLRLRLRLHFDHDVDSPVVVFMVLTEDGRSVYQMTSAIGQAYRHYRAGEEAEVEVRFTPRLAAGTFRVATAIMSNDHLSVLARDDVGAFIYLTPRLGALGMAELEADITVDGTLVNYVGELTLGAEPSSRPPVTPA
jgi:ABC-type polysaccharide/polyol phosphate transport system ATPase subunit